MRIASCLLLLASCSSLTGAPTSPPPAASLHPSESEGMAPTPYSSEQIRRSNPTGTVVTYRVSAAGQPDVVTRMEWVSSDDAGCSLLNWAGPTLEALSPAGAPRPATWVELRNHASFPETGTTITRENHGTPAGEFDCWKYAVDTGEGPLMTFWFDVASAGSPVDFVTELNGQVVQRMLMLDSNRQAL